MVGKRPLAQSKVPESTTTPPMLVPWPSMYFVAECTTMSAPHSMGRHRYGVANVLSTISGTPCSWAMPATVAMSRTLPPGLPMVSAKSALVFGRSAARHAAGSSPSTNVASIREFAEHALELRDAAAVDRARRDDVVARLHQRVESAVLRRQPTREGHRARATLQVGDALLEDGDRRVHDSRVDIAVLLQVEVGRRALGILEDESRALVNRNGPRASIGIGALPGVHSARLEAKIVWLVHRASLGIGGRIRHAGAPVRGGSALSPLARHVSSWVVMLRFYRTEERNAESTRTGPETQRCAEEAEFRREYKPREMARTAHGAHIQHRGHRRHGGTRRLLVCLDSSLCVSVFRASSVLDVPFFATGRCERQAFW